MNCTVCGAPEEHFTGENCVNYLKSKLQACLDRLDVRRDEDGSKSDAIDRLEAAWQEVATQRDHYSSRLDECRESCARAVAARDVATSRLEHYRLALEGIVRMGSDNYGIISEAAKAADFALNAPAHDYLVKSLSEPLPAERDLRDNAALTANKPFVVERQCPEVTWVAGKARPIETRLPKGDRFCGTDDDFKD